VLAGILGGNPRLRTEAFGSSTVTGLRQALEAEGLEFTDGRKPGVILSVR